MYIYIFSITVLRPLSILVGTPNPPRKIDEFRERESGRLGDGNMRAKAPESIGYLSGRCNPAPGVSDRERIVFLSYPIAVLLCRDPSEQALDQPARWGCL